MSASCSAVKKLSGVAVPSCSWGSSQRDAKPACQARTSLPLGAAPANGIAADTAAIRISTTARGRKMLRASNREYRMSGPPLAGLSTPLCKECRRLARGHRTVKSCQNARREGPRRPEMPRATFSLDDPMRRNIVNVVSRAPLETILVRSNEISGEIELDTDNVLD